MKQGEIKKGFKPFRTKVEKSRNSVDIIKNCKTCKYYNEDDECVNTGVTEYDMVRDTVKKVDYCTYWTPSWHKEKN